MTIDPGGEFHPTLPPVAEIMIQLNLAGL